MSKIAAVTMQYNERFFLPRWLAYYGAEFGPENLYVIDNDSDIELPVDYRTVSRVRYPRTAFDDQERAKFVSEIVRALLVLYDTVVFTDCDEFLAPDARKERSLRAWIEANDFEHVTSIGLNIVPNLNEESALVGPGPILGQRRQVQFVSPMCKANIVRKPVQWGGGFHHVNRPPDFRDIYLFHMKRADLGERLDRLAMTRSMQWAHLNQGNHQRISDLQLIQQTVGESRLPVAPWSDAVIEDAKRRFTERVRPEARGGDVGTLHVSPLDITSDGLMTLPEAFHGLF